MNHFLAKFKYLIESDRVSNTPTFGAGIGLDAHYEPNGPTIAEFVKPPVEHLQKT